MRTTEFVECVLKDIAQMTPQIGFMSPMQRPLHAFQFENIDSNHLSPPSASNINMSCRLSLFRNISTKRSSCDGERNHAGFSRLYLSYPTNKHHSSSMNEDRRLMKDSFSMKDLHRIGLIYLQWNRTFLPNEEEKF
jgi:hypothetical protein